MLENPHEAWVVAGIVVLVALLFFVGLVLVVYGVAAYHVQERVDLVRDRPEIAWDQLKTGDLLLFGSTAHPVELWVETCTYSYVYHVGMIVRPEGTPAHDILLWEIATGPRGGRAVLRPLRERLEHTYGEFCIVRQLEDVQIQDQEILHVCDDLSHVKYSMTCIADGTKRMFGIQSSDPCDADAMYCSQLIGATLERLQLAKTKPGLMPADFTEVHTLHLTRGTLGPERLLATTPVTNFISI